MSFKHAVVWIDHYHAKVIDFSVDSTHVAEIEREAERRRVHQKSFFPGTGKGPIDHVYYDQVAEALGNSQEILIVGPGNAKLEFQNDLKKRHAEVAKRVLGVESADHPSDGELLAFARKWFKRVDSLNGNT